MSFVPFTPMDDLVERYGEIVSVEYFQTLTNNLNYLLDSIPVGEIRPIYVIGSLNVPDSRFWQECNGSAITDLVSPLRGFNTPDLVSSIATINSLSFRAKVSGTISITYVDKIPGASPVAASAILNPPPGIFPTSPSILYTAVTPGASGNAINIQYVADIPYVSGMGHVNAFATVVGNAITVHINIVGGVLPLESASTIVSVINSTPATAALVHATLLSPDADTGTIAPTFLHGGLNSVPAIGSAGNEVVTVSGHAIQVRMENGVSTIQGIKAKLDASAPASALVSTSISPLIGTTTQAAPIPTVFMSPGVFLKGATTLSDVGFTGGQNSKNLSHNHTGRTLTFHLDNNGDTDDDRWSARNDHTHGIQSDLTSVVSIQPAHVRIKHYIKIN